MCIDFVGNIVCSMSDKHFKSDFVGVKCLHSRNECVAGVVGEMSPAFGHHGAEFLLCCLENFAVCVVFGYKVAYFVMNGDDPVFACLGFQSALKISVVDVDICICHREQFLDAKSAVQEYFRAVGVDITWSVQNFVYLFGCEYAVFFFCGDVVDKIIAVDEAGVILVDILKAFCQLKDAVDDYLDVGDGAFACIRIDCIDFEQVGQLYFAYGFIGNGRTALESGFVAVYGSLRLSEAFFFYYPLFKELAESDVRGYEIGVGVKACEGDLCLFAGLVIADKRTFCGACVGVGLSRCQHSPGLMPSLNFRYTA